MLARRSKLLVGSLRLAPVLLPRHRFAPPRAAQAGQSPGPVEAPAAWPVELGLIAMETFVDTVRQRRPEASAAMAPGMQATIRLRGHAQRARAQQLGLTAASAPRAAGAQFDIAPAVLVHGALALYSRRQGIKRLPPLSWRAVLIGKAIGELDRRRSWRSARGGRR
jgi:hypothetical protein